MKLDCIINTKNEALAKIHTYYQLLSYNFFVIIKEMTVRNSNTGITGYFLVNKLSEKALDFIYFCVPTVLTSVLHFVDSKMYSFKFTSNWDVLQTMP